ncbi:MAG: ATP-binding protein, partial [Ktedonobacteraceae bacterium]|nr:ATP-binding protein [Ktedonobacteraceae bacterium]
MLNAHDVLNTCPRRKAVGITKGPGESTHEYTFVSRDDEQVLKNGEYVYYELTDPQQSGQNGATLRHVLGRIIKRVPLKLYPDTFLGEPEIPPAQVAAMVGYNARTNELFELHVAIMGY